MDVQRTSPRHRCHGNRQGCWVSATTFLLVLAGCCFVPGLGWTHTIPLPKQQQHSHLWGCWWWSPPTTATSIGSSIRPTTLSSSSSSSTTTTTSSRQSQKSQQQRSQRQRQPKNMMALRPKVTMPRFLEHVFTNDDEEDEAFLIELFQLSMMQQQQQFDASSNSYNANKVNLNCDEVDALFKINGSPENNNNNNHDDDEDNYENESHLKDPRGTNEVDITASNYQSATFGDIMASSTRTIPCSAPWSDKDVTIHQDSLIKTTTSTSSLPSTSTSSLAERYGLYHPLDRMALTANGNLQRLVSSYYDAPVSVVVDHCLLRPTCPTCLQQLPINNNSNNNNELERYDYDDNGSKDSRISQDSKTYCICSDSNVDTLVSTATPGTTESSSPTWIWDRVVHLTVDLDNRSNNNHCASSLSSCQTFCKAISVITVHDPVCQALVESGQVGLGQLFRFLDILPEFILHEAGPLNKESNNSNRSRNTSFINNHSCGDGNGGGGGGFWRDYTLTYSELTCQIHEEFVPGMWTLQPLLPSLPSSSKNEPHP